MSEYVSIGSHFQTSEWMDTFQMNPKAICANKAFHHPHDMQAFYPMHNIKALPTRPHPVDAQSSNGEKHTGDLKW